jgi:hypothetical protein
MDKDMRFEVVPAYLTDICGNEVKRFMCALEAYKRSPRQTISIGCLIDSLSDIDMAKKLKKFRAISVVNSCCNRYLDNSELDIYIPYAVEDVGDIFNYSYYFFWEEEKEDDLAVSEKPLKRISKKDIEIFEDHLKKLLPDTIKEVEEEEVLLQNSSSMGIDSKTLLSKPVYLLKEDSNLFETEPSITKRSHIRVYPANTRDSVIQSVGRTNSIKLIDMQVMEIVENISFSAHYRNPDKFESKIRKFAKKYTSFFNRDIEKEGITKPRELITCMLRVLKEKYPNMSAWKYAGIFDNWIVWDPEIQELSHRKRGTGLGMANALTTLMQCVIFSITVERMAQNEGIEAEMDAIFLNDDASIGFKSQNDFENYIMMEEVVFDKYGLLRKLSKSHYGPLMVFCENYICESQPHMNEKISYKVNELYNIFAAQNIVHAKMISGNLSRNIFLDQIEDLVDEITAFWGYEFFEEERKKPSIFGGWFSPAYEGVRTDFEFYSHTWEEMRAMIAVQSNDNSPIHTNRKGNRIYNSPMNQIYHDLELPEEVQSRFNYSKPIRLVANKLDKFKSPKEAEKAFEELKKRRKKDFDRKLSSVLTIEQVYRLVSEFYESKDFLPPRQMVASFLYEDDQYIQRRVYRSTNPTLSLLKFFNNDKIKKSIIPERFSGMFDANNLRLTAEEKREANKWIQYARGTEHRITNILSYKEYLFEKGHHLYMKPECIRGASEALWGTFGLPVLDERYGNRFTNDEIRLKKVLFNHDLGPVFETIVEKIGFSNPHISSFLERPYEIYNFLSKIDYKPIVEKTQVKEEKESEIPNLSLSDYWYWTLNQSKYEFFSDRVVERTFFWIYQWIATDSRNRSIREMRRDESVREVDIPFTPIMQRAWTLSGGKLDDRKLPILSSNSFFDEDTDSENGGLWDHLES